MQVTLRPEAPSAPRGSLLASSLVRLIGLWILVGALFKLLQGFPSDLPPVVLDFRFPADVGLKYKAIIGAELCIVAFALLRPRWGWIPVALQLAVFVVVLVYTLGEPSCGCFGGEITMPPWLMLCIDGALLLALLAARPWRTVRERGLPVALIAVLCAVGIAAPWYYDREIKDRELVVDGEPVKGRWVAFDLADWVGMDVSETPLAQFIDPYTLPSDGLWVFWRSTCDHCSEHMDHLIETEVGDRLLTMLRLNEQSDTEGNRVVHALPSGPHVVHEDLPDSVHYVITTPGVLEVEAYVVISGEEAIGLDEEERKEAEAEAEERRKKN